MNNKQWLVALPIIMLVISSCSASNTEINLDFDDHLTYSWDTLSLDDVSEYDILSFVVNDYQDYYIAIESIVAIEDHPEGLADILVKLETIGDAASQSLNQLYGLSSSQLRELSDTHTITLTIDDIVRFNDFKALTETQTQAVSLTKQTIIEDRINRSLTAQEVYGFESIQSYLNRIHQNYSTTRYLLNTVSYEEFEADLVARQYTLTDETKAAMEAAFVVFELIDQD